MTDFGNVCQVRKLISEIAQLRIKLSCVLPLQFTRVEIPGLDDAKFYQFPIISFSLSAHNSMKEGLTSHCKCFLSEYCTVQIEARGKAKRVSACSE